MLTSLRIRNFKAWEDTGPIRFAPLTVLFGANSAGKSSIPQLLLLLKQTAESSDRRRALHLGDERSLVDAGTFEDVVHGHDLSRSLEFELSWLLEGERTYYNPASGERYDGDALAFHARLGADSRHRPEVEHFRYELLQRGKGVLDLSMQQRNAVEDSEPEFELSSERYDLKRFPGRAGPLPPPLRFYGFPPEAQLLYPNAAFTADFVFELERMLTSIYYVGPLREYPKRLYLWSGEVPEHVGERGDRAVECILASGERAFSFAPGQPEKQLPELVAERLRAMRLIDDFDIRPIAPHRREYEVLVRTGPKSPEVKLTDVGFGVSQVLPVIVECLYVPRRSIVIFEQPEIHLHPSVQADLADLFVDAIRAEEDGKPRECQFIIESHSEHFLRRLQRRIAEEALSEQDAALYFVHTGADGARLEELDVDAYGNIRNWPEGFFGDEMADLVARTEAQARRMQSRDGE